MRERIGGVVEITKQLARSLRPNAVLQVTVPSIDRHHRPLPPRRARAKVFEMLLEISPGATALSGVGVWRDGSERLAREPVSLVFTHLPSRISQKGKRRFLELLGEFIRWANQDALMVTVNNRPFFLRVKEEHRGVVPRREMAQSAAR